MTEQHIKKKSAMSWGIIALMLFVAGAAIYVVKAVLSDDSPRNKPSIATVTLLKPPPPQIKEKPPEPEPPKEIQKKEDIIDPGPQNEPNPQNTDNQDNTPAGDKLGLDAEGGAGSDGFGLVGKKGGRSITLGGSGGGGGMGRLSLMSKFSGYNHLAENEIRKTVMRHLTEDNGIPRGKFQAVARIRLDMNGAIVDCKIVGSSGHHKMDEAIKQALAYMKVSEPPPNGMPLKMDIKFTYQS
jgi:periplasmic protein TonB